jgi:hypothetical protein
MYVSHYTSTVIQGSIANCATDTANEENYNEELNTVRGDRSNFIIDDKLRKWSAERV